MNKKDFLTFDEISVKETSALISLAHSLKKKRIQTSTQLKGKTLAMIFEKPSTRTRVSFEVGMYQLGGHAITLSSDSMQLSRGESHADTAKTLSRYTDMIMARVFDHSTLEELAKHSSIPVINGLSNSFHPCQILADLLTIYENKKKLRGLSDEPDLFERGEFSLVCVVEVAWLNYFTSPSMDDFTVATSFFTERNFPCMRSSDGNV